MTDTPVLLAAIPADLLPVALQQRLRENPAVRWAVAADESFGDEQLLKECEALQLQAGLLLEQRAGIWQLSQFRVDTNRGGRSKLRRHGVILFHYAELVAARRLQPAALGGELLVKAVLGRDRKGGEPLRVIDATAGLGRDALLLAAAGCSVTLLERNPLLAFLVACAIETGVAAELPAGSALQASLARMNCRAAESCSYLRSPAVVDWRPDVVYLDPMFAGDPTADGDSAQGLKKTAGVKKPALLLQKLDALIPTGDAASDAGLLEAARAVAQRKVVVKRALRAPWLGNAKPGASLAGKSVRFDIYAN